MLLEEDNFKLVLEKNYTVFLADEIPPSFDEAIDISNTLENVIKANVSSTLSQ